MTSILQRLQRLSPMGWCMPRSAAQSSTTNAKETFTERRNLIRRRPARRGRPSLSAIPEVDSQPTSTDEHVVAVAKEEVKGIYAGVSTARHHRISVFVEEEEEDTTVNDSTNNKTKRDPFIGFDACAPHQEEPATIELFRPSKEAWDSIEGRVDAVTYSHDLMVQEQTKVNARQSQEIASLTRIVNVLCAENDGLRTRLLSLNTAAATGTSAGRRTTQRNPDSPRP